MGLVLVVDDEPDIRDLIRLNLEVAGHRVASAGGGEEALEAVLAERPDAVVLDVLMPGLDGWELLKRLKDASEDGLAGVPVLMVTALGQPEDRVRAGIEGALRFITKPFDPGELVKAVDALLAPGAPSEEELRRQVRSEAMQSLARLEASGGDAGPSDEPRVRLTKLERSPGVPSPSPSPSPRLLSARERLAHLTVKQRDLLSALVGCGGVTEAADLLGTSRSNVYAGLRRVVRRLGLRSTGELIDLLREGLLPELVEPALDGAPSDSDA